MNNVDVGSARKRVFRLLFIALLSGCMVSGAENVSKNPETRMITAFTQVEKWGQMPVRFEIRGQQLPDEMTADHFTITGEATGWGTSTRHMFSCKTREIIRTKDGWDLIPEQFPDKYFYVCSFSVLCERNPEIGFTKEDISKTLTETADSFTLWETDNHFIKAQVYQPQTAVPLPVVVVFHGYGDTENLLTYRTAVDWAEPEHQAVRPCTVIAPTIDVSLYGNDGLRSKIYSQVLSWIDEMIAAGTADPDRIYLMGNSFGGMAAIEMAEQHPDRIAAVMALCPALNYSFTGMRALSKMAGIPLYIAHAENDETIPVSVSRTATKNYSDAGGNVILKIYSDEEMEAAGAVHGQEQTYSFHHVELALLEDDGYAQWLFGNVREP